MDLTKASKKYQEYWRADKHQSVDNKAGTPCSYINHSQICYLEQLVTCEEVSGRLQDSSHGFSQLFVHRSGGGRCVWLGLENKLCDTSDDDEGAASVLWITHEIKRVVMCDVRYLPSHKISGSAPTPPRGTGLRCGS